MTPVQIQKISKGENYHTLTEDLTDCNQLSLSFESKSKPKMDTMQSKDFIPIYKKGQEIQRRDHEKHRCCCVMNYIGVIQVRANTLVLNTMPPSISNFIHMLTHIACLQIREAIFLTKSYALVTLAIDLSRRS